jgi:hypothetical protein
MKGYAGQGEKMGVEEKVFRREIAFGVALKVLQRRLSTTQEGMARLIGCTLRAYTNWVAGGNLPTGDWMLKILALCPDEDTRNNFLDIGETGSKIPSSPRAEVPIEKQEVRQPGAMHPDGTIIRTHKFPRKSR